jgi:hypothetical protein
MTNAEINAVLRLRGNTEWWDRYVPGRTIRDKWRWLYAVARAKRNDIAFAIVRPDGTLWEVL